MGQEQMGEACVGKLCGRGLTEAALEVIRRAIVEADPPLRAEVARRVCAALGWHDALSRPKLMSCRVGLLGLKSPPKPRRSAFRHLRDTRAGLGCASTTRPALAGLSSRHQLGLAEVVEFPIRYPSELRSWSCTTRQARAGHWLPEAPKRSIMTPSFLTGRPWPCSPRRPPRNS